MEFGILNLEVKPIGDRRCLESRWDLYGSGDRDLLLPLFAGHEACRLQPMCICTPDWYSGVHLEVEPARALALTGNELAPIKGSTFRLRRLPPKVTYGNTGQRYAYAYRALAHPIRLPCLRNVSRIASLAKRYSACFTRRMS